MNDKELLTLAAKSAGYTLEEHYDANGEYWPWCVELEEYWHPLLDDGDALRLAVKLKSDIRFGVQTPIIWCGKMAAEEIDDDDLYAATRRAIVRAAAEIGKGMK